MNDFLFYSPTEFHFGRGAENAAGECCRALGARRAVICYGGGSAVRSGVLGRVEASLREAGVDYREMGGIKPNPTDDRVYEGIKLARSFGADLMLAVGGGSVIDTAKAIAGGVPYDGDFWDFWEGKAVMQRALNVGVVLTIPAAGSEASGNSVITRRDGLKKISLKTPKVLRPKFALMNPELTFTLPAYQTAAGATDMIAHILERYFNNAPATLVTDALSEALIREIVDVTPRVLDAPDNYDLRACLMWSGTLAHNGICGTGVTEDWTSHFLEHEISAVYGVTHGAGLAVVSPAYQTFMATHHPARIARLAHNVWGVTPTGDDKADALSGIERMKAFLRRIGMPVTFAGLGIEHPDIPLLTRSLHAHKGNPVGNFFPLTPEDTTQIYTLML